MLALPRLLLALLLLVAAGTGATSAGAAATFSSRVVEGSDGYLFTDQDWTVPCQHRGASARTAERVRALLVAVQRSGRPATFVVGPDKATVRSGNVPRSAPQRACGQAEKDAVWRALHDRLGGDLLDLRRPLASAGARHQTYWRQDTHWTPTAGTVYARELAGRLDLLLARRLRLEPASATRRGDLAQVSGRPGTERVAGVRLVNPGVRVEEHARGHQGVAAGSRHFTATPVGEGARVVPGRTLFLGDSFDGTAVHQLAPLFEDVVFLWPDDRTSAQVLVDAVAAADRVVVERVERFTVQWRPYDDDVVQAMRTRLPQRLPGRLAGRLP